MLVFHRFAPFAITETRFIRHRSTCPRKKRDVIHPHVPGALKPKIVRLARVDPRCAFYPLGYKKAKFIESVRAGDYLGEDWPWCFIHKKQTWNARVYNSSADHVPFFVSSVKGVAWYPRKREWHVQWVEDGKHHVRAFKTMWGIVQAQRKAEQFRMTLEALGRVDNRQTLRQKQETIQRLSAIQRLQRKNTFVRVKEDLMAEWNRYWDSAKFHWEDNHIKQQRRKLGKVVDPTYRPPDINIEQLRKMK